MTEIGLFETWLHGAFGVESGYATFPTAPLSRCICFKKWKSPICVWPNAMSALAVGRFSFQRRHSGRSPTSRGGKIGVELGRSALGYCGGNHLVKNLIKELLGAQEATAGCPAASSMPETALDYADGVAMADDVVLKVV